MELPPFPACAGWLAGFHRASPSTPLDAYCYVVEKGTTVPRRIPTVMPPAEDPLSHAEPATLTVRATLGSPFYC